MAWVKLDDQFFINRKARAVGLEGRALAAASWCYCAMQRNNGIFLADDVAIIAAMAGVPQDIGDRLIEVGLWHRVGDQIEVHDYLEHNLSNEQMIARSEKAAKAAAARHAPSSAPSRPPSTAPSQPIPSPSPDKSSSSSSTSDLVPDAVWLLAAKKKMGQGKKPVGDFSSWSQKVIRNDKAEKADDAAWIWQTYRITEDQLAGIIATGSRAILNTLPKREEPAA